jgi:hypothetical protein
LIREYCYQRASINQICDCARWTLNLLQMRDWKIEVAIADSKPDYGTAEYDINTLAGLVIINKDKLKADNKNPYSTVIHEILHIFIGYRAGEMGLNDELIIRTLEPILYREWCRDNKRKEANEC